MPNKSVPVSPENVSQYIAEFALSANIEKSDVFLRTNHPCRLDFERFGQLIEIPRQRLEKILDKYMQLPIEAATLVNHSFLTDKMKRYYLKIVQERISRFKRVSE